jgi:hemin uptake protein HemP
MNVVGMAIRDATPGPRTLQPSPPLAKPRARELRQFSSTELFGGGREVLILHADETYCLRQTKRGKLILTK